MRLLRSYLKKVFWPNLGVGRQIQHEVKLPRFLAGNQNPFFEIASIKCKIARQAHWLRWALCGLIAVMGVLVPKAHGCPLGLPVWHITVKGVSLTLEIAATPEQRECGLSNRDGLPTNTGMLFVLPETMPFAVWMKDTRMPLSVAFLDAAGQILAIEQMAPLKTDVIYESPRPVCYAIEVNRDWFLEHDVRVGDSIHLKLPPGLDIH